MFPASEKVASQSATLKAEVGFKARINARSVSGRHLFVKGLFFVRRWRRNRKELEWKEEWKKSTCCRFLPRPRLQSPTGRSPTNVNTCSPESIQEIINQKATRCAAHEGELAALFIYILNHYYGGVVSALNNKLVSRLFTARARNQHVLLLPLTCPSAAFFFFFFYSLRSHLPGRTSCSWHWNERSGKPRAPSLFFCDL